jgi:Chalcone isomerase-like
MDASRRMLMLAAAAAVLPAHAQAPPPELAQALPAVRLHGEARLRFLGLHVYDIRLWTAPPFAPERWAETPLALEILYARSLVGRAIAERSLDEMRRQGELPADSADRWLAEMTRLFPDVRDGDRILGVTRPDLGAAFYFNGRLRGEVRDPAFARRFFGIWLAPQTSEPGLRQRLLGSGP